MLKLARILLAAGMLAAWTHGTGGGGGGGTNLLDFSDPVNSMYERVIH